MTLIDPSRISSGVPAPNTHYHIVDNTTTLTDRTLTALNDQLSRRIEELENSHKQELCELKNLLKDQNQEISDLKKLIKKSTEKPNENSNAPSNLPIKNTMLQLDDPFTYQNLIYRTHGFQTYDTDMRGRCAGETEVMIECKSNFPKEFTLDVKGHIPRFRGFDGIKNGIFEVYVGKLEEKRHKQEFQLFQQGYGEDYTRDYASVSFKTEDEDNNTIWINLPKATYDEEYKGYKKVGMKLYSLNIIPREK
ncbi:MAG: hypothetical protein ON057_000120 [Glomeribacter sp. 1016415]|nr:hypothetical protein [Glomeribacter sp. 1016415]